MTGWDRDELPPEAAFMPLAAIERARRNAESRKNKGKPEVLSYSAPEWGASDGVIEPTAWDGQPLPLRHWIVPGLVPRGEVTFLTGNGGEGKSLLTMQLLASCAMGMPWLGRPVPRVRALGVYTEDHRDELQRRLDGILGSYGRTFADTDGLTLASRRGKETTLYVAEKWDTEGQTTTHFERLRKLIIALGAEVVILDSLYDYYGADENNRGQARGFVSACGRIAEEINGAVIVVAHPSRSGMADGSGTAGVTAWHNAVRSRLYLHREKVPAWKLELDPDARGQLILEHMKANYGPTENKIQVEWDNGCFVVADQSTVERSAPRSRRQTEPPPAPWTADK